MHIGSPNACARVLNIASNVSVWYSTKAPSLHLPCTAVSFITTYDIAPIRALGCLGLTASKIHQGSIPPATLIVDLILSFCNGFLLFIVSLSSLSLGITILGLSQADDLGGLALIAAVILASAAIVAIVTSAGTIMLQLTFDELEGQYERIKLMMAWVPSFLLGVVVLEVAVGALLRYTGNYPNEFTMFLASDMVVLTVVATISLWVRGTIEKLVDLTYSNDEDDDGLSLYCSQLEE